MTLLLSEPRQQASPHVAASIVRLLGVSKTYENASIPAMTDLNLEVRAGEFFSLLGPSGSGKTTTLRLIGGFEQADRGRIVIDGIDVTSAMPFERDVNTVFQSYALFPHMTVEANIHYPLKMRRVPAHLARGRISDVLDLVGMAEFRHRLPQQLSGGQRQRVALARALVGQPKVLLLDEPLGALDLQLRQQMQLVLRNLQRQIGITFIYVTHDQTEALSMSDRLAVMNKGSIQQLGTPQDLYFRPANRFVAGFMGRSNILDMEICSDGGSRIARRGELKLPVAGEHSPGQASVAIRLEALRFVPASEANGSMARVTDIIFLGDGHDVVLDCCGTVLTARVAAHRALGFSVGDDVGIAVDKGDVAVLRD